uniref:Glycerophosphodiester phosphodiesterase domain containing 5 n=1 Tax=Microcebus murinus TaxID=30608 RepID=A0A8B7EY59_MICMU|nr:glycerophosphodiester phosphodiesterase domain-containing protein 5 isoform X1 [Microcebus murinus]XP_012600351.1 glycerophosphodiester phosphodiesterase domain-containing protein 5 isoform X1 [Microcebus murinus]XP_012600352.1 glycerophosphodiester phosphodiesterase domain-containing protein 5 isoform X1 [Microcebus murinus]XP_012600353.1 glycerophosphodiester phosphodiesterase domain-containing protein 5 isoform X1 [Microcebus murinus]XP_012600354.1 glycerophosphodiester phosphodiesterase 
MVRHQPLQYYEPQLCLSCLTGIYGCRWKRYQRSHDDTTPWERLWFLLLTFTFGLTLTWLYFWWEVHNDYDEFNWYLYNRMGYWSDWPVPILVTTAAAFTYIAGLLVLALCHIAVGQQMNLHWLHKIGLVVILACTVVAMSAVAQLWEDEWEVLLISLQGTAPFLHVGALAAVTVLSWIVAGQFARAERSSSQVTILCTFFAVVFALYLAPLTISSPCIMEKKDLGPKPALIGHRGAPMLAPEHTLMSFRKALEQKLYGVQADITISLDGVPFLMHDATLRRTTNVEEEFPELARRPASMLNWTVLQRLNAGQWFLKTDPFWTASSLSPSDHKEAQNQSICSLAELLELAKGNATLLLNLRDPPREHPYRSSFLNVTLEAVLRSGFPQHQVMWLPNRQRPLVRKVAPGFQQTSGSKEAVTSLRKGHIQRLNLRYTQVSRQELRDYASWNLSVNLYTVNAPWLFSLLWCAGVPSVTSDNSHTLSRVPSPLWIMAPDEYCLMWVTTDLISFTLIVGIFVLQNYHLIRWRLGGIRSYNPEQIMLSAAVRRTSRDVSIMKEKLIFSEISDGVEVSDELSVCSDNSYDTYANSNTTPVGPRGAGSRAKTLTDRSGR